MSWIGRLGYEILDKLLGEIGADILLLTYIN